LNFAYKAWVVLEPYVPNDVPRIIVPMIVVESSQILHKNIERDQYTRRKHLPQCEVKILTIKPMSSFSHTLNAKVI
jgi:hypothetical protein